MKTATIVSLRDGKSTTAITKLANPTEVPSAVSESNGYIGGGEAPASDTRGSKQHHQQANRSSSTKDHGDSRDLELDTKDQPFELTKVGKRRLNTTLNGRKENTRPACTCSRSSAPTLVVQCKKLKVAGSELSIESSAGVGCPWCDCKKSHSIDGRTRFFDQNPQEQLEQQQRDQEQKEQLQNKAPDGETPKTMTKISESEIVDELNCADRSCCVCCCGSQLPETRDKIKTMIASQNVQ